jgi:DNA (cytosine-5)-methyltransferase 1
MYKEKNINILNYKESSNPIVRLAQEDEALYTKRMEGELSHPSFKLIDLFCGAGGMTLGFSKAFGHNFLPVWANDNNIYCVETYRANFGNHCFVGDIISILSDNKVKIPEADVVIGGPPCQGFSLLNRNREGDPRRQLWMPFLEVVDRCNAKVFVIENVPQLLGSIEHGEIVDYAEKLGFKVASNKLLAADYGVPQTRTRAFIIGSKISDPNFIFPPRKTHFNPKLNGFAQGYIDFSKDNTFLPLPQKWRTVKDAISDLSAPIGLDIQNIPPPYDIHFGRTPTETSLKRYKAIPKEGMNRFDLQKNAPEITPDCWIRKKSGGTDLFGRLWWDRPAFTIRTEFFKPEKGRYLHPQQHRPITHREAARLQSFPDNYVFKGTKIEIAKQIGNAVPPMLAARIADIVYVLLTKGQF